MNSHLLKDQTLEAQLEQDGVVRIPFLTQEELAEVQAFYKGLHGGGNPPALYDGIHMTIWSPDLSYKLKIKENLERILAAACERNFKNYRAVNQQFIVKLKGEETTFPVHQDWSIVDESKYTSFNIWVPLQDVNENNGAMWILKKSHNINRPVRGAGYLFPNYNPILEELKKRSTVFSMKAGEALIFFLNTIHGSPANQSENERVVIQSAILPDEASFQIYHQPEPGLALEVHHPKDDFTYHYERLREDSMVKAPTDNGFELLESYVNNPVTLEEVLEAISH
ncbi:MAG: phytanoyl-CoA dioxygenase family protein [Chitinophagales bacterium]